MPQYQFITHWEFDAPVEQVWKEIRAIDAWPGWWKYVETVKLMKEGDEEDIGSIRSIVWSTALPYRIRFETELVAIEHLKRIEGKAVGELSGTGIWTFERLGGNTHVRYDWEVSTTKKWMNLLAPVAKPIFTWNHDKVMAGGYEGLKARLAEKGQGQ